MPAEGHSTLLIVDDYPENLVSMRALLQRQDWQVITAASGFEALGLHDLEVARAFNASVLDNAAEGILVLGEDGLIRFANPAMSRLLSATVQELEGKEFLDFLQKPHIPVWADSDLLSGYKRGETLRLHDALLRTAPGQQVPVALSCAPLPSDQHAMVVTVLDMSVQAAKIAEKLIERVSICQQIDGLDIVLGASIGIATFPDCGANLDGLMRASDIAMYEAKRAGRQQYRFYDHEMNGRARSRLMLEESVRTAIENRDFNLVYQPQVAVADGRTRGFEALLRWQHPSVGDVPPGLFLPLLEEARLISRLGSWIYQNSAGQRKAWETLFGEDLVLSVSLSSTQFAMPNLVTELRQVVERHGLKPRHLEVEVTEAALMHNPDETRKQLRLLRNLGVRVALDDFGSGPCSLSHLRDLEMDTLKLDRHLISRIPESSRDAALVRNVIDLFVQPFDWGALTR
eukprot:gene8445-8266_t